MTLTFDPEKERRNQREHGLSLARYAELTRPVAVLSPRGGEDRWLVFGWLDGVLHAGVITRRDGADRVLSLRPASRRERKEYARVYP